MSLRFSLCSLEESLHYIDEKMKEVNLAPILKIPDAAEPSGRKKSKRKSVEVNKKR